MIIIGEKINGSIPIVAEAIAKRDSEFIKARAKLQAESGATYIDCCASVPEAEEVETLKWMIDCIQEVTDLPISIDSPSPDVLAQAYKFCKKPGIFNSVSGEGHKIDTIFPIMAEPGNEGWQVDVYKRQTQDRVLLIAAGRAFHHTFFLAVQHWFSTAAAEPALAVPLEKLMSCNSCKRQMLWPGCPKISYILEFIIWKKGGIQFRDQIETLIIDRKQINILAVEI